MRTRYGKRLKSALGARVDSFGDEQHHVAVALYDELAASRVMVVDTLKMYEASVGSDNAETRALAGSCLQSTIARVRDICLAISKIEKDSQDHVSRSSLDLFIRQVGGVVERVCGEENAELGRAIIIGINEDIELPDAGIGKLATSRTPDMTALDMDAVTTGDQDDRED